MPNLTLPRTIPKSALCGFFLIFMMITGCRNQAEKTVAAPAPPAVEVTVAKPVLREMTDSAEYTGHLEAVQSVEVRARVTGFLQKIHYAPRARVENGSPLFTIDPRPFQAALDRSKAEFDARQADLVKAEWETQKVRRLQASGATNEEEQVTATANLQSIQAAIARARAEVERAELDLDFCSVDAPIPGRVSRNMIDVGNIVTADETVLATITNDEVVFAYVNASERDVLTVRARKRLAGDPDVDPTQSHPLRIPASLGLLTDKGFPHIGHIDYASPEVNPATGTIEARARFENRDGVLIPGLFAKLKVPIGEPYTGLTVTERALASDQGQRYVLVVNAESAVEYRSVKLGALQDGSRVIAEGLSERDLVIVNGMQRVRPGMKVTYKEIPMPNGQHGESLTAGAVGKNP